MKHIFSEMLNLLYHINLYTTLTIFFQMSIVANRTIERSKIFAYPFSCCRHCFHLLLLTQLVFFSYSWYTWNWVFYFVQPPFFVASKLCGLLMKIPKINPVNSNSDSLENTSRAYLRNLGHRWDLSKKKRAKKCWRRVKYLKIQAEMYKIWKYLKKGQVIACNNCTQ